MNKIIISLLLCYAVFQLHAQQKIEAEHYGVKANSFENAATAIVKAINACKTKSNPMLVLPTGRIDIWPDGAVKKELYVSNCTENDTLSKVRNIAFYLSEFDNLTIEGSNTLVVLHGKIISFAIINCRNVTIKNISFDYERPSVSEMTFTKVTEKIVEAKIHPDSKYEINKGKFTFYGETWKMNQYFAIEYSPVDQSMKYRSFQSIAASKAQEIVPYFVRFEGDFSKNNFKQGSVLTIRDPYRDNCGGFISISSNIKLDNIQMNYMHGLGIVSQFSENITLQKVKVAARDNSKRVISSFADCFHFSGCKGKIVIDSCFTSGSHDDPINVHGTHLQITSIIGTKVTVRFMHHQTYGFEAFFEGDSIAFVNPQTLQFVGLATVKKASLNNPREMELEIEGKFSDKIKLGFCIENLTWTPEVSITNSRFERTYARGILLTTRKKILVSNNVFYRSGMHAILIANDASGWFESGRVQDVTISQNTFTDCAYNQIPDNYVIAIVPENHQKVAGYWVHYNITIENNVFNHYDYPVLKAKSVKNLVFRGNTINGTTFLAKAKPRPAFDLNACTSVVIEKNVNNIDPNVNVQITGMKSAEIKSQYKLITIK